MTPLQRAHEELRKEAISLRRENAKLKAGTYIDKDRALRKFKRKMKQAVTFRSKQSMEDFCNCMGVIETNRLYDINIFQLSTDVFSLVPV